MGFSLIELLVALAIASILLAAVVTFTNSSTSMNRSIINQANAVNQAKNAFNYISRDFSNGQHGKYYLWRCFPSYLELGKISYQFDGCHLHHIKWRINQD